jgi:hypothetical protein
MGNTTMISINNKNDVNLQILISRKEARGGEKRMIENGEKIYALKLIITDAPFKPQHIIKINKHEDRYNCSYICHVINT